MKKKIVTLVVRNEDKKTGISTYAEYLEKELIKKNVCVNIIETESSVRVGYERIKKFLLFDIQTILKRVPFWLRLPKEGIVHLTDQQQAGCLLWGKNKKSIVTVHDLIPLTTNEDPFLRRALLRIALLGLHNASRIIADSSHTKQDIVKYVNYPSEKIDVVPLGIDHTIFRPSKRRREKYRVLYVGSEMPRKNLVTLFRAFALVKRRIPEAELIKIGSSQWPGAREELVKLADDNKLKNSIIFKDVVENLVEEYQKATVFVFPSHYEGFGLPVLEAMACGCPVICSNVTSLPEVGGEAVIFFNPSNESELADRICHVLTHEDLQRSLSRKGIKRAKCFSWKKTVKETVEVYHQVVEYNQEVDTKKLSTCRQNSFFIRIIKKQLTTNIYSTSFCWAFIRSIKEKASALFC